MCRLGKLAYRCLSADNYGSVFVCEKPYSVAYGCNSIVGSASVLAACALIRYIYDYLLSKSAEVFKL